MTKKTDAPRIIEDKALDEVSGGPAYKTPGVYIEEVSLADAGVNPMDLKRGGDI